MRIIDVAMELLDQGLVVRSWGNLSGREDESSFRITPSGRDYKKLKEEDMVLVGLDGSYQGNVMPSSEKDLHAKIYQAYPEANFIIHTHQDFGSAFTLASDDLTLPEDSRISKLNHSRLLPLSQFAFAGSTLMHDQVCKALARTGARAVLIGHHGVIIYGESAKTCLELAQEIEVYCRALYEDLGLKTFDYQAQLEWTGQALISHNKSFVQALAEGLDPYLEDFAQLVGEGIRLEQKPEADGPARLLPDQLVIKAETQRDGQDILEIIYKNFLAQSVARKSGQARLAPDVVKIYRTNYLESYSQRY